MVLQQCDIKHWQCTVVQFGPIVQRLERLTVYQDVAGSNPAGVANRLDVSRCPPYTELSTGFGIWSVKLLSREADIPLHNLKYTAWFPRDSVVGTAAEMRLV